MSSATIGDRRLPERFWRKVSSDANDCWLWGGAVVRRYGVIGVAGQMLRAHRYAYASLIGPLADELQLDHLCGTPLCVNPAHLEPVTQRENLRRMARTNKTHCVHGHEFTPENTYMTSSGHRYCRECKKRRQREAAARGYVRPSRRVERAASSTLPDDAARGGSA